MKKITTLLCASLFVFSTALTFAGNKAEVIIAGQDLSKKAFVMDKGLVEGEDYISKKIILKVKPAYRQNCKVSSIDNILQIQDFLNAIGGHNLAKIYPTHQPPVMERNSLGQKMVDISLIYSFEYTADIRLEKAINNLKSLGYFEYVEPWYIPKTQFTPNDGTGYNQQYHLKGNVTGSINTQTAWDTQKGNTAVVIGIVDTGTEPTHPDLAANYLGGYDVAMKDNDATWQGNNHGCGVSGDACAVTNNGAGVASPGFNCKFKAAKIADASGALTVAYEGITWAADNGCKIINCSWGGSGGGSYGQDIINYAAINKNCVLFCSAGNGGADQQMYPSSYNNVYRVASSTNTDAKSSFSDYGFDVDFASPGSNIYSTVNGTGYGNMSGTSMASPVAAGAAGLVQSHFNYTNAFQIGERLKQTCDPMSGSSEYTAGKLGKGRIDVGNAVSSVATKSVVANPINITDGNDNNFLPGEILSITGNFINYLDPASAATAAVLTVVSGPATVTSGNFTIGALATLAATNNNSAPFTASISSSAGINTVITFKLTITDGAFTGAQYFDVIVNVDYINIVINDVHTTITSRGKIGYNADGTKQGLGFVYQIPTPNNMLYEMSLMIGASSSKVSDCFRGPQSPAGSDADFVSTLRSDTLTPSAVSDFGVDGKFNDAGAGGAALPVEVHHSAYAWNTAPYRKFVIVKYVIKNTGASTLSNLYAGIVADWDITNSGANKGNYDAANKMGYCYDISSPTGLYAGIKVLSSGPMKNYIIDLVTGGNGGVDAGTDFLTGEKYTTLSTSRNTDNYSAAGGDVMNCVSTGPFTVSANDSITVAFALIAGSDLPDLKLSACAAQGKWDQSCNPIGIEEAENDNFWMYSYPNPATTSMNINYNVVGYENASIRIINSLGELIMSYENLNQGQNILELNVEKLSAGSYFYQLKANDAVMTKQFTIVK